MWQIHSSVTTDADHIPNLSLMHLQCHTLPVKTKQQIHSLQPNVSKKQYTNV